jgi:hypothetical protein
MREFGRPQNDIARFPFYLGRLPVIQAGIEEIKIVTVRVMC